MKCLFLKMMHLDVGWDPIGVVKAPFLVVGGFTPIFQSMFKRGLGSNSIKVLHHQNWILDIILHSLFSLLKSALMKTQLIGKWVDSGWVVTVMWMLRMSGIDGGFPVLYFMYLLDFWHKRLKDHWSIVLIISHREIITAYPDVLFCTDKRSYVNRKGMIFPNVRVH